MADDYGLFEDVQHRVELGIKIQLQAAHKDPPLVHILPRFQGATVELLPAKSNFSLAFFGSPPQEFLEVTLPNDTGTYDVVIRGYLSGYSVIGRNTANIAYSPVFAAFPSIQSYRMMLILPNGSNIIRLAPSVASFTSQSVRNPGENVILIDSPQQVRTIGVLYQPQSRDYLIFGILAATIIVLFTPVSWRKLIRALSPLSLVVSVVRRRMFGVNPSKIWLKLFVALAISMFLLSFAVGPDPRPRVYVLAAEDTTQSLRSFILTETRLSVLTPAEEFSEIQTLANLGGIQAFIIGDFNPPNRLWAVQKLYPALDSINTIVAISELTPSWFLSDLNEQYGWKVKEVESVDAVARVLTDLELRGNPFGFRLSPEVFQSVVAVIAVMSLSLPFLGLAFLSARLAEEGRDKGTVLTHAIAYSFFVFMFTLAIYMVSSVLLALPVGLHTSSVGVTALGTLGFGGGTRPRMVAGILGFLVGAISVRTTRVTKQGVALIAILLMLLLVDPLFGGRLFHEFVLAFSVGGSDIGEVESAFNYVFSSISGAFGSWASPVWSAQRGQALYYMGAVGFAIFSKLRRNTGTLVLVLSSFLAGDGFVRVADLAPFKSMASFVPGVALGMLVALSYLAINSIEVFVIKLRRGQ